MKKLLLRNFQSPGDILMLTAAVRDLHKAFPGQFLTDVRTSCPTLWENNPYLTPLSENDPEVERIDCGYPLIHQSNQSPGHFLDGFIDFLSNRLKRRFRPTAFRGDLHLSSAETSSRSPVAELTGRYMPYWLLVAGGKYDFTIKWWHFRRFQEVVNLLRDRILFVQVGESGHFHPDLHGVLDLRGKTTLRDLIRLTFHSEGVFCPVTFLMHLAAAIDMKGRPSLSRPCVVVAGGREPPHWETYPGHQFVHTVGALPCCSLGGCWRSRTVPLGDGDEKDRPEALCVDVVQGLPHCMDLITAEEIVRRITLYIKGGITRFLTPEEAAIAHRFTRISLAENLARYHRSQ